MVISSCLLQHAYAAMGTSYAPVNVDLEPEFSNLPAKGQVFAALGHVVGLVPQGLGDFSMHQPATCSGRVNLFQSLAWSHVYLPHPGALLVLLVRLVIDDGLRQRRLLLVPPSDHADGRVLFDML